MLHVLLILLKIAGILLGLVIGLLLLVLAAPIRYSFQLNMDEETPPGGQLRVTWLLCVLYAKVSYIDKVFDYRVRVFGYQIMGNQKAYLERKQRKQDSKEEKKARKKRKQAKKDRRNPDTGKKSVETPEKEERQENLVEISEKEERQEKPVEISGNGDRQEKPENRKENERQDVEQLQTLSLSEPEEEADTTKKNILSSLREKTESLKALWQEYHGEQLLDFAKESIIKILRHVLPRRIRGYLRFGFDDPAVTGVVTGIAAMFYPRYQRTFTLEPDFGQSCFAASCRGRGRIHPGFFLYMGIRALWNKEVRAFIKKML